MTAPGKTRRSVLWTDAERLNPPATAGYSRRRRIWTETERQAERNRRPYQRRPKVDIAVTVDTSDAADLWRKLAGGNDDVLAIVGVVLDLARLRHLDCPDPPVRHGATTHTWHVYAADLIAPGIRGADYRQPKFTSRQTQAAVEARVAIEQFVILATVES